MRVMVIGFLVGALSACAPSGRDIPLAGLDLADGTTLASLQNALPRDQRAALGTYALLHWPKSKFYCGRPIGDTSALPATIGEAVDQTLAYEKQFALAQSKEQPTPQVAFKEQESVLISRMDQLLLERDKLYMQLGPAADATPRGGEIKQGLADIRNQLDRLRRRYRS